MDWNLTVRVALIVVICCVVFSRSYLRYRRRAQPDPESLAVRFQRGEFPGNETSNNEDDVLEEGKFTDKLR